ncbi:MAG: hypothetical protein L6V93_06890 [Clostridiales bacterium]|nr:MAG: hypothetical protein L6V93_06890 [Clostridiales bacterium]
MKRAIVTIGDELNERAAYFKEHDKILEMQRLLQRTNYDLEMMQEVGFLPGN